VGDLVFISSGARVPADVRMLSCNGLKLETSSITGEAEPIEFTCEPAADDINVFESHNVAFNGSFCVDGEGLGIVIRVADKTVSAYLKFIFAIITISSCAHVVLPRGGWSRENGTGNHGRTVRTKLRRALRSVNLEIFQKNIIFMLIL
jgi:P-type E1-E2 ATPase